MAFHKLNLLSSEEPFNHYEAIAKSKYKYKATLYGTDSTDSTETTKSTTYNIVKNCYSTYESNKETLENVSPYSTFSTSEKEALLHCYNGNTKKVKDLKDAIINNQNIHFKTKCAYCAISDSHSIDHYLPKDIFPEFSIHSYNLVPSCSYCNSKKDEFFLDSDGYRIIFNPYFEEVEDEPILECIIECLENCINSELKLKDGFSNKVCENHLRTLNLLSRYKSELPRILCSIMFDIIANFEENQVNTDGAKRVLERKLNEHERIQGINSLDAVIIRAYLESDQLFDIDYIKRMYFSMDRLSRSIGTSVS
ncbi:HNH endonuclease [Bacillus cereus]|uniref:HNH endonuclease n=1 Tax=Bacillus cereus TaxID=1396 RepID=A0A2B9E8E3_BACCE|nr:hypothetical protein [Bacillus cereus]PGM96006.1 hypothetical protein CN958_05195 [Bacillus cereus]